MLSTLTRELDPADFDMESWSRSREPDSKASDENSDDHVPLSVLLARLHASESGVRMLALQKLGNLEPAVLAQVSDAVFARLEDAHGGVRREALRTLHKLKKKDPTTLAQHADVVNAKFEDLIGRCAR